MRIYPAVDIKSGRAVRLIQGKADAVTNYGDPIEAALMWQDEGASVLHIVDLDGAFTGSSVNLDAVTDIVNSINIPVQLGGGIRNMKDIEDRLDRGVARVILGTIACENPELVSMAAKEFPNQIVVGIDALNGKVAVRGWVDSTQIEPIQLALNMKDVGINTIIYTDISRDGMLTGPNIRAMKSMVWESGMQIIASGGVGKLDDLYDLSGTGVNGVIMGKALYSGSVKLQDALKLEEVYAY